MATQGEESETMEYTWVAGSCHKANAQVVGDEIMRLQERLGGHAKPIDIVNEGRRPDCPWHGELQWDDAAAAAKYRLVQAAEILRHCVEVVVHATETEPAETRRAFVRIIEANGESVYVPMARVRDEPDLYRQALEAALKELQAFQRKYKQFAELRDVGDEAVGRIESLLDMEPEPQQ